MCVYLYVCAGIYNVCARTVCVYVCVCINVCVYVWFISSVSDLLLTLVLHRLVCVERFRLNFHTRGTAGPDVSRGGRRGVDDRWRWVYT